MKMNQKGIAYLLVLILGGIIVTSSIVYYSSTLIESRVSTNSRMAKELFYFAEGSIHNATIVLSKNPNLVINGPIPPMNFSRDITNTTDPDQLFSIVTFNQTDVTFASGTVGIFGNITDGGEQIPGLEYNENKTITYDVISQGHLIKNQRILLPRKISNKLLITFTRFRYAKIGLSDINVSNTTSPNWQGFNYGVNSGTELTIDGSSKVINGGVYAKTKITLKGKNQLRIEQGEAYTSGPPGSIEGEGKIEPVGNNPPKNFNLPPLTYPTINADYYKSIADLILPGNRTFNSFADIPITHPGEDGVIVVYIDGNLKINADFFNTQSLLLVVNGTVTLNGTAEIGSSTIPFGIIATGDINKENGNAKVNGFFYTPGKIKALGNFKLTGALVGAQGVDLGGNAVITFDKSLANKLPLILDPDNNPSTISIRVTASPGIIYPTSGSSTITWDTTNATNLTSSHNLGSSLNGSAVVSPGVTTRYTFTATGPGGTVTVSLTITVQNEPPSTLPPDPEYSNWTLSSKQFLNKWKQEITKAPNVP